jgi:hypothetical protein
MHGGPHRHLDRFLVESAGLVGGGEKRGHSGG